MVHRVLAHDTPVLAHDTPVRGAPWYIGVLVYTDLVAYIDSDVDRERLGRRLASLTRTPLAQETRTPLDCPAADGCPDPLMGVLLMGVLIRCC
jgi:hypothetical protein